MTPIQQIYQAFLSRDYARFEELSLKHPEAWRQSDGRLLGPFFLAASDGLMEYVKFYLDHGVEVNQKEDSQPEGVLNNACRGGNPELVAYLIQKGATINHVVEGEVRCLALTAAIFSNNLPIVKLLIEAGAAINNTWAERTPLDCAYDKPEIAAYLRLQGAKTIAELHNAGMKN